MHSIPLATTVNVTDELPTFMNRKVAALVLGIGLLVPLAGCGTDGASAAASIGTSAAAASASAQPSGPATPVNVSYRGRDGATALDLLLEHDPSAQVTGSGEQAFVTAIGGYEADSTREFWAVYLNGQMSPVGAGSLQTTSGDMIEWKLEQLTK